MFVLPSVRQRCICLTAYTMFRRRKVTSDYDRLKYRKGKGATAWIKLFFIIMISPSITQHTDTKTVHICQTNATNPVTTYQCRQQIQRKHMEFPHFNYDAIFIQQLWCVHVIHEQNTRLVQHYFSHRSILWLKITRRDPNHGRKGTHCVWNKLGRRRKRI